MARKLVKAPSWIRDHMAAAARRITQNATVWPIGKPSSFTVGLVPNASMTITAFTSSNPAVFTVTALAGHKYRVTQVAPGSATLTLTMQVGGVGFSQQLDVTIL